MQETVTEPASRRRQSERTTVQKVSLVTGAVFILVGALGFVPAVMVNTGDLEFAGDGSQALLLGLFQISVLHNAVHLLYGLAGIVLAATAPAARSYLIMGGLVYLLLWMYGLLVPDGSAADFLGWR